MIMTKNMMNNIYKHVLVASLLMVGGTAMAQTLNSAYFTEDYKFLSRTSRTISPYQPWAISMSTYRVTSVIKMW